MENFRLEDYIEIDTLDFFTKYALIITNFIIILVLLIYNKFYKTPEELNPINEKHNILIIISKPSDIIKYFFPTIVNHKEDYYFHILCLSAGCANQLETIAEKEFEKTCGFLETKKCQIFQDELLKFDTQTEWPVSHISNKILDYVGSNNIKALISFDDFGVNGNDKNISIAKAFKLLLLDEEKKKKLPENFKMYELITVNFLRKMLGIWDFLFCILHYYVYLNMNVFKVLKLAGFQCTHFDLVGKMKLVFSRYSYVNTLKRIK